MQARILSRSHSETQYFNTKRSLKSLASSNMTSSTTTTSVVTEDMTALDQVRARSNSYTSTTTRPRRNTRVHFEIQEAGTPEFYGSKWLDMLSLYSGGSSSFEVAIAALCSVALFVLVKQGFSGISNTGVVLAGVLFVVSFVHWALMYFFAGSKKSGKKDTPLSRIQY
ncbi:hypothetical protein GGS20DRAFT_559894 [Poronia punctata]|nr:hypothetical protein GGS20DRAFT_559894 [Poronia punctata]